LHPTIIRACPKNAFLHGRFRQTENHIVVFDGVLVFGQRAAGILLLGFIIAREVGTDRGPGASGIGRAKDVLRGVVDDVGIVRRNHDGHRPGVPIFLMLRRVAVGILGPFLDALGLAGAAIEAREDGAFVVGVNDVRIARVGNDVAAFAAAHGVPIALEDRSVIAARANAERRVVLLRAVDAILKVVVGGDVVKLRGRLIVLRSPVFAAVDADGGAAVVAVDHAIGIVGIDPESVIVAMGGIEACEGLAAVG